MDWPNTPPRLRRVGPREASRVHPVDSLPRTRSHVRKCHLVGWIRQGKSGQVASAAARSSLGLSQECKAPTFILPAALLIRRPLESCGIPQPFGSIRAFSVRVYSNIHDARHIPR